MMGYKLVCNTLLLLLINFLNLHTAGAQHDHLRFKYLTSKEGLQSLTIYTMVQDFKGFIWFGTDGGLYRYDGYEFSQYANDLNDASSLMDNIICGIIEDKDRNLWIGTTFGVELYNRDANSFIHIPIVDEVSTSNKTVWKRYINNLFEDKEGNIFVGTRGTSLYKLDKKNKCIRPFAPQFVFNENLVKASDNRGNIWITSQVGVYKFNIHTFDLHYFIHKSANPQSIASNKVFYAYVDKDDNVWIATDNGLNKIDGVTKQMKCYKTDPGNPLSIPDYMINQIYEDSYHNLWFCTENGLCRYDRNNDSFIKYDINSGENNLRSNKVKHVIVDRQGILWVGFATVGIAYAKLFNPYGFETLRISAMNKKGLDNNSIISMLKDNEENLWLGTDGGGLCQLEKQTGKYHFYYNNPVDSRTIGSNSVMAIFQDNQGDIWVGTYLGGFSKYNKRGAFETFKFDVINSTSKAKVSNDVRSFLDDDQGNLLLATCGDGVIIFNKQRKTAKYFFFNPDDPKSISSNYCSKLYKDSEGEIWVGTYNGLCKWNMQDNSFTNYLYDSKTWKKDKNSKTAGNNTFFIYSIHEDAEKNLWIGTTRGLYEFNKQTQKFINFNIKDGLPSNVINGVLEDKHGNLWMSTNHGISKFNMSTKKIKNYDAEYGLQGNQFLKGSYFADSHGEMYFGGIDGLTKFYPESIKDNRDIPNVYITEFKLLSNVVKAGEKGSPLTKHISETKEIILKHNQSFFSFKYVALNYINSMQINYAYMMEGFDKDWHLVGNERTATYTNLDPGNYVFRVKACNNDGYWNEQGASIKLTVKPPIWRTTWAYLLYMIMVCLVIYGIIKFLRFKDGIKQQLEIQRIEADKQHKLGMLRLQFFTNISHEFRTPLTLILGPAEKLIENTETHNSTIRPLAETIWRNGNQLLKLVNQLLDFRKIDAGAERLNLLETDIVKFTADLFELFQYQTDYKGINYKMNKIDENVITCFDPDKMEKILYNLLSNAIKYTPAKGSVTLAISETRSEEELKMIFTDGSAIKSAVKIEISDTGIGIPDDEKEKIFDPFYQVNPKILIKTEGSGLGLSIVKQYIVMHHGVIILKDNMNVYSKLKEGTTFDIYLPIVKNKDCLFVNHIENNNLIQNNLNRLRGILRDFPSRESTVESSVNNPENLPVIMVVEDNNEMRWFLCSELRNEFHVLEASNGKDGINMATKEIPDLIISDIMMTDCSGIELCKQIKTDMRTSHIPVILLTALSEDEYKIEGLETGADDYLTKPFNFNMLILRIKNLIDTRKQLQEKFSHSVGFNGKAVISNATDQQFMEKIYSIVEKNMENPEIDAEQFIRDLGMSRTHVYKKIKAITGQTLFEFIYTIRLKKAAEILLNEKSSVSEVATRVGYSNLSVFTRSFTRQFKINPSKYAQIYNPKKDPE